MKEKLNSATKVLEGAIFMLNSMNNLLSSLTNFCNTLIHQRREFTIKNWASFRIFKYKDRLFRPDYIHEFLPVEHKPYEIKDFFLDIN